MAFSDWPLQPQLSQVEQRPDRVVRRYVYRVARSVVESEAPAPGTVPYWVDTSGGETPAMERFHYVQPRMNPADGQQEVVVVTYQLRGTYDESENRLELLGGVQGENQSSKSFSARFAYVSLEDVPDYGDAYDGSRDTITAALKLSQRQVTTDANNAPGLVLVDCVYVAEWPASPELLSIEKQHDRIVARYLVRDAETGGDYTTPDPGDIHSGTGAGAERIYQVIPRLDEADAQEAIELVTFTPLGVVHDAALEPIGSGQTRETPTFKGFSQQLLVEAEEAPPDDHPAGNLFSETARLVERRLAPDHLPGLDLVTYEYVCDFPTAASPVLVAVEKRPNMTLRHYVYREADGTALPDPGDAFGGAGTTVDEERIMSTRDEDGEGEGQQKVTLSTYVLIGTRVVDGNLLLLPGAGAISADTETRTFQERYAALTDSPANLPAFGAQSGYDSGVTSTACKAVRTGYRAVPENWPGLYEITLTYVGLQPGT